MTPRIASGLFAFSLVALAACAADTSSSTADDDIRSRKAKLCGGFAGLQCPSGQECVDDPSDGCDPKHGGADCNGICKPQAPAPAVTHCGGFAGLQCPSGQECVDDPSDGCDPKHGGADCGGICKPKASTGPAKGAMCGGIAHIACPKGQTCVDDPSDTCDPAKNGADCSGICQ
jgi:hypothetical protein